MCVRAHVCAHAMPPGMAHLDSFDYEPKKGEVQDMIWEVDESMDGTVSYLEFSLMYRRVIFFFVSSMIKD